MGWIIHPQENKLISSVGKVHRISPSQCRGDENICPIDLSHLSPNYTQTIHETGIFPYIYHTKSYKINDSCKVNIPFVPWIPSWAMLTSKCRRAIALAAKPKSWCMADLAFEPGDAQRYPFPKTYPNPFFFGRVQWFLGWFHCFFRERRHTKLSPWRNDETDKSWASHEIFIRI